MGRRSLPALSRKVMLVTCALSAFLASGAIAQKSAPSGKVIGEWTGPLVLDQGTQNLELTFRAADSTVSGQVYSNGSKFADMEGVTVKGDTVHFKMQSLDFTGTIEGATMKVSLIMFNGSTRHFTLRKTPPAP